MVPVPALVHVVSHADDTSTDFKIGEGLTVDKAYNKERRRQRTMEAPNSGSCCFPVDTLALRSKNLGIHQIRLFWASTELINGNTLACDAGYHI